MNLYCPHCGVKNQNNVKQCVNCKGSLSSIGSLQGQVILPSFTPVMARTETSASSPVNSKSDYLARLEARRAKVKFSPSPGEPTSTGGGEDGDDDNGVQHFDAASFSGVLDFESQDEDSNAPEKMSFHLPNFSNKSSPQASPVKATPIKRGRPAGSKNKK